MRRTVRAPIRGVGLVLLSIAVVCSFESGTSPCFAETAEDIVLVLSFSDTPFVDPVPAVRFLESMGQVLATPGTAHEIRPFFFRKSEDFVRSFEQEFLRGTPAPDRVRRVYVMMDLWHFLARRSAWGLEPLALGVWPSGRARYSKLLVVPSNDSIHSVFDLRGASISATLPGASNERFLANAMFGGQVDIGFFGRVDPAVSAESALLGVHFGQSAAAVVADFALPESGTPEAQRYQRMTASEPLMGLVLATVADPAEPAARLQELRQRLRRMAEDPVALQVLRNAGRVGWDPVESAERFPAVAALLESSPTELAGHTFVLPIPSSPPAPPNVACQEPRPEFPPLEDILVPLGFDGRPRPGGG